MSMFTDKQVAATSPLMQNVYHNFETNLRDTIVTAQKSGARVIVSTVGTNTRDCAPFASKHRDMLADTDLKKWTELFQQGSALEENGHPTEGAAEISCRITD